MAYTFKRQIFGFMDLLRFKKMVPTRRRIFQKGSPEPLKKSYKVNETARILHPGYQDGKLKSISLETPDTKTFTFELERPVFFRAGHGLFPAEEKRRRRRRSSGISAPARNSIWTRCVPPTIRRIPICWRCATRWESMWWTRQIWRSSRR